jgi:23S rRNA (adenine2503-C2)-methyltransferase
MRTWTILRSRQDASVNFVSDSSDGGFFESRFVQRTSDYFISYLSSHTGCKHACRFCHLTATGQTMMTPATIEDYVEQARQSLAPAREQLEAGELRAKRAHFNFMARGEALSNAQFVDRSQELFDALAHETDGLGVERTRFLVSSILPHDFSGDLSKVLADERSILYYSLYSVDPDFRRRWLPRAMPAPKALDLIAEMQAKIGRDVALHWAFIEGQNDSVESVERVLEEVTSRGIRAKFNLVRYNPHDQRHGVEPNEEHLQSLFKIIAERLGHPGSRIVPRVGKDVKASCGMFVCSREDADYDAETLIHD